jgi:D-glycero-alpha-D-manno-heptose 1-phosphate guanylyltransferase
LPTQLLTGSINKANLPTVLILAGGLGTRLKSIVHDRPKALAETAGVPFLEIQLQWLSHHGFKNVVLLTGHKSKQIASYVENNTISDITVKIVCEQTPLGTGGAVLNALQELPLTDQFLLINGDSLAEVDLKYFCEVSGVKNTAVLLVSHREDASRYGIVNFDKDNKIVSFHEKTPHSKSGWVNSGIYYFPKKWFNQTSTNTTPISLEKDMIPQWLNEGRNLSVFRDLGRFIDIGTPESYNQFRKEVQYWFSNH